MENIIKTWLITSNQLKALKETELELRKLICDKILDGKIKGSKSDNFGVYIMTATAKTNKNIDKELLKTIWSDLSKKEKSCFEFNPKLIEKKYKEIDKNSNVHRVIEEKPGTPTLKLKSIKED